MDENNIFENQPNQAIDYMPHMVSAGLRFVNYLIDTIVSLVFIYGTTAIYVKANDLDFDEVNDSGMFSLYTFAVFILYYLLSESIAKRTIGKLVTGTKVISVNGEPLTFFQILGRTAARLIPFEPFSLLGGSPGWHDSLSKTRVVKTSFMSQYANEW